MTHRPLDYPELRACVAQYLSGADRKTCALVCKAWYDDFQPFVWKGFAVNVFVPDVTAPTDQPTAPASEQTPKVCDLNEVVKYAHLIKYLRIWIDRDTPPVRYQAFLERLYSSGRLVTLWACTRDPVGWQAFKELIRHNQGLKQIYLNDSSGELRHIIVDMQLHSMVSGSISISTSGSNSNGRFKMLQMLEIHCQTTVASLAQVLVACPALTELHVTRSLETCKKITSSWGYKDSKANGEVIGEEGEGGGGGGSNDDDDDGDNFDHYVWEEQDVNAQETTLSEILGALAISPRMTFPLKKFYLLAYVGDPLLVDLLRRCPELELLELGGLAKPIQEELCVLLRTNQLPHLRTLYFGKQPLVYGRYAEILMAMPELQLREIEITDPDPDIIHALNTRHTPGLETVRLLRVANSIALVDLMLLSSRLKNLYITARGASAFDIRYLLLGPWACLDLEELEIQSLGVNKHVSDTTAPAREQLSSNAVAAALATVMGFLNGQGEPAPAKQEPPAWVVACSTAEKQEQAPGQPEWIQAQLALLRRLGQLTKLRKLRVGGRNVQYYIRTHGDQPNDNNAYDEASALVWSLSFGFAYLAELSLLEELDLGPHGKLEGLAELEFMKDCWGSTLKHFACGSLTPEARTWLDNNWPELTVTIV